MVQGGNGGQSSREDDRYKQYDYSQNASLVISQGRGRSRRSQGGNEPTGEAETLWGRVDPKTMGDRAGFAKPDQSAGGLLFETRASAGATKAASRGGKRKRAQSASQRGSVLDALDTHLSDCYKPRSAETQRAYEALLSIIREDYGDQPQDVIRFAADEILQIPLYSSFASGESLRVLWRDSSRPVPPPPPLPLGARPAAMRQCARARTRRYSARSLRLINNIW